MIKITTGLVFLFSLFFLNINYAAERQLTPIKVQLKWSHQSQFAGMYVAQVRKYFEREGLDVIFISGGPGINSLKELHAGKVDIAIGALAQAWDISTSDKPLTNIGQIFSEPSIALLCRASAGVYTPKDIVGKRIGFWDDGDKQVVIQMLEMLSIKADSVQFVKHAPDGSDIVAGKVACGNVMNYSQFWTVIDGGVPFEDILLINPNSLNVSAIEDGVYVLNSRLESQIFQSQLLGFMRALRDGWKEAKLSPLLALEATSRFAPDLARSHHQRALESVLALLPNDFSKFGYFDLERYSQQRKNFFGDSNQGGSEKIWTHAIWNELSKGSAFSSPIASSTKYYLEQIMSHTIFKILVFFGVFTYALSGVLEAINRNYDFWGRLILGFLSGVGGGTLRDIVIGGDQIPFYYVKDYRYMLGILIITLVATTIAAIYPNAHKTIVFKNIKKYADVFGFSALAVVGASISVTSQMPWYWAPICAALTCAGGGVLRDIIINQEPATLKGVIYEEVAIVGALFLLLGLFLAGYFEYSMLLVLVSVSVSFLLIVTIRIAIYRYELRYPSFLGGQDNTAH